MKFPAAIGLALAALLALPAAAKEGDTFRPFVSLGYFYDDNLFRLDDDEAPGFQREDRYGLLNAGINVDWRQGRQQVVASASKTLIRYDRNAFLDFDGDDLQGTWNWRLGNRLSGRVGASRGTSQSTFDDIGTVNNEVNRKRRFGRAEWEFHPRWSIGGGTEKTDNSNSTPANFSQDFEQWAHDVGLNYRTPKGSSLRLQARRIDADFPNQQILGTMFVVAAVANNSFSQTEYTVLGDWRASGKLALRGQAGWVERSYDNILLDDYDGHAFLVERPNYSGVNGRVSADWSATGKTLLSVAAYRELGGAQDINASSVLKRGVSVSGIWLVREKWRLNAATTFERRDFKGDMGAGQPPRTDDTLGGSLSLSYAPTEVVSVDVGMRAGRRDSNMLGEDYEYRMAFASLRADF